MLVFLVDTLWKALYLEKYNMSFSVRKHRLKSRKKSPMKKTILFSMIFFSGCAESAESALLKKISVGDCVYIAQSSSSIDIPGQTLSLFNRDIDIPSRSTTVNHDSFIINVYKGSNQTCTVEVDKKVVDEYQKITEVGADYIVIDGKKIIPIGKIKEINLLSWREHYESWVRYKNNSKKYLEEKAKEEKEAVEKRKNLPPDDGERPGRKEFGYKS